MRRARPKAIFFDMDDTILSAYGRPEESWQAVLAAYELLPAGIERQRLLLEVLQIARRFWADPADHRYWRQRMTEARREIVRQAFAACGSGDCAAADALADHFSERREADITLFPGAHETLDRLKEMGFRLALVTNGAALPQRAKIERFALAHRFEHVLIEGELGYGKPEDRIYRDLLARCGVTPAEAWMVGDNLEWEVAAPRRHGICSVWADLHGVGLPGDCPIAPDHIITSLPQILEILAETD